MKNSGLSEERDNPAKNLQHTVYQQVTRSCAGLWGGKFEQKMFAL